MPTIVIEGYKFRFYSSDVNEPPHVHVLRGEDEAKIGLHPVVVEHNRGYGQAESYLKINTPESGQIVGGME